MLAFGFFHISDSQLTRQPLRLKQLSPQMVLFHKIVFFCDIGMLSDVNFMNIHLAVCLFTFSLLFDHMYAHLVFSVSINKPFSYSGL